MKPTRSRLHPALLVLALSTLMIASCDTEETPVDPHWVTPEEYEKLKAKPGFIEDTAEVNQASADAAKKRAAEDEAVILAEEAKTGLSLMPSPPVLGDGVVDNGNGTLDVTVPIEGGDGTQTIVTLGHDFAKHGVAESIRTVNLPKNKLSIYEKIYAGLTPDERGIYGLPDPSLFRPHPEDYDRVLSGLVDFLSQKTMEIVRAHTPMLKKPKLPICSQENGGAKIFTFSEGLGSDSINGGCAFKSDGIFSNIELPLHPHMSCVRNQGRRGSCSSFAAAAALEIVNHKVNSGSILNLSEQMLYGKVKTKWVPSNYGDGAWVTDIFYGMEQDAFLAPAETQWSGFGQTPINPEATWIYNPSIERTEAKDAQGKVTKYFKSCAGYGGVCSETVHQAYKYCTTVNGDDQCGYAAPDAAPTDAGIALADHNDIWDPTNPQASVGLITLAVIFKNPVVLSFKTTYSWNHPTRGYVSYYEGEGGLGAHAVLIVGFVGNADAALIGAPDSGDEGYFVIKNSWSGCWGDGGYAYVPVSYVVDNGLEAITLGSVSSSFSF